MRKTIINSATLLGLSLSPQIAHAQTAEYSPQKKYQQCIVEFVKNAGLIMGEPKITDDEKSEIFGSSYILFPAGVYGFALRPVQTSAFIDGIDHIKIKLQVSQGNLESPFSLAQNPSRSGFSFEINVDFGFSRAKGEIIGRTASLEGNTEFHGEPSSYDKSVATLLANQAKMFFIQPLLNCQVSSFPAPMSNTAQNSLRPR